MNSTLQKEHLLKHSVRFIFLTLAITWAGVIFYLSSRPIIGMPSLFSWQDKLLHIIAFGVLGFFLIGGMKTTGNGYRTGQVWFVVVLVALYGLLDEFHQYFVPGRDADIFDVLADATGALLGAWTMFYLVKMLASRATSHPPM